MKSKNLPPVYRLIAEEAFLGFVVFNKNGECLFHNPHAEQLFGAAEPHFKDLIPQNVRPPLRALNEELLKHEGLHQDIMVRSANGSFVANLGVKPVTINGTPATLLMLQDVTLQMKLQREITAKQIEIKSAFEELLKQNQQLKELDVAKNRFIALTTHELRTPLAAIFASAEILKMKLYDTPEQMDEFVEMIYDQGKHLSELVNDILDFAKIQAGKMDFHVAEFDAVPFTETIVNNYQGMAEANNVQFVFESPSAPLLCHFDDVRLRQVLSNIINNAIKYNRAGGTVRVYFADDADFVKVFVKDSGKGIAREQFDKVFNEFETIGAVSQHHKGTGLGMPISRKLTEAMGGKLLLESEEGVGSTFWVELPKKKVLEESFYQPRIGTMGDFAA